MTDTDQTPQHQWTLIFLCWLLAAASSLGSLFFSEVMQLPPCALCWYQRAFMFPLVIVLLVGLFPFDPKVVRYALPITLVGGAFAFYHLLLYTGVIPQHLQPCSQGVSCTEIHLDLFGFVTIPLLSLMAFTVIAVILIIVQRRTPR